MEHARDAHDQVPAGARRFDDSSTRHRPFAAATSNQVRQMPLLHQLCCWSWRKAKVH